MRPFSITGGRDRLDDHVREATASLRGAALAIGTAVAAVREQLATEGHCPDADPGCLEDAYAALLRHRRRVDLASREIARLERTSVDYGGVAPSGAPEVGWDVPSVTAARRMVDQANDTVTDALLVARTALASAPASVVIEA